MKRSENADTPRRISSFVRGRPKPRPPREAGRIRIGVEAGSAARSRLKRCDLLVDRPALSERGSAGAWPLQPRHRAPGRHLGHRTCRRGGVSRNAERCVPERVPAIFVDDFVRDVDTEAGRTRSPGRSTCASCRSSPDIRASGSARASPTRRRRGAPTSRESSACRRRWQTAPAAAMCLAHSTRQ